MLELRPVSREAWLWRGAWLWRFVVAYLLGRPYFFHRAAWCRKGRTAREVWFRPFAHLWPRIRASERQIDSVTVSVAWFTWRSGNRISESEPSMCCCRLTAYSCTHIIRLFVLDLVPYRVAERERFCSAVLPIPYLALLSASDQHYIGNHKHHFTVGRSFSSGAFAFHHRPPSILEGEDGVLGRNNTTL